MTERSGAFVIVPMELLIMVSDGKLSPTACVLYQYMLTRVNRQRGDAKVWPSRRNLAAQMGWSRAASVDKYLTELVDAGLLRLERRHRADTRENDTNVYTLSLLPPRSEVVRNRVPPSPQLRTTVVRKRGPQVVRDGVQEPDEVELDEEELDLSLREGTGAPSVGAGLDRERDQQQKKIQTPTTLVAPHLTDPANAEMVIDHIVTENKVKSRIGFFIAADGNGTLPELVRDAELIVAGGSTREDRKRFLQEIGWEPKCEHGVHGGHIQQPGTGWVACAMERARLRQAAKQQPSNRLRGHTTRPTDGPSVYDDPDAMRFSPLYPNPTR